MWLFLPLRFNELETLTSHISSTKTVEHQNSLETLNFEIKKIFRKNSAQLNLCF